MSRSNFESVLNRCPRYLELLLKK